MTLRRAGAAIVACMAGLVSTPEISEDSDVRCSSACTKTIVSLLSRLAPLMFDDGIKPFLNCSLNLAVRMEDPILPAWSGVVRGMLQWRDEDLKVFRNQVLHLLDLLAVHDTLMDREAHSVISLLTRLGMLIEELEPLLGGIQASRELETGGDGENGESKGEQDLSRTPRGGPVEGISDPAATFVFFDVSLRVLLRLYIGGFLLAVPLQSRLHHYKGLIGIAASVLQLNNLHGGKRFDQSTTTSLESRAVETRDTSTPFFPLSFTVRGGDFQSKTSGLSISRLAAGLAAVMATDVQATPSLLRLGISDLLSSMVTVEDVEVGRLAAFGLATILEDDASFATLTKAPGGATSVQKFVRAIFNLADRDDSTTWSLCTKAMESISSHQELSSLILEEGTVAVMISAMMRSSTSAPPTTDILEILPPSSLVTPEVTIEDYHVEPRVPSDIDSFDSVTSGLKPSWTPISSLSSNAIPTMSAPELHSAEETTKGSKQMTEGGEERHLTEGSERKGTDPAQHILDDGLERFGEPVVEKTPLVLPEEVVAFRPPTDEQRWKEAEKVQGIQKASSSAEIWPSTVPTPYNPRKVAAWQSPIETLKRPSSFSSPRAALIRSRETAEPGSVGSFVAAPETTAQNPLGFRRFQSFHLPSSTPFRTTDSSASRDVAMGSRGRDTSMPHPPKTTTSPPAPPEVHSPLALHPPTAFRHPHRRLKEPSM